MKENHDLLTEWEINPPLATPRALLSHVKTAKVGQPGEHKLKGMQDKTSSRHSKSLLIPNESSPGLLIFLTIHQKVRGTGFKTGC